ncbi:aminotransferase class V-fold PLP-dependent enzyme [Asticcacaulis sp. 201]|uniref:aminotransferase class V-fold PLP-dependent enzyme n=1 Tax=Asticcacaulis sp. 201 TaxID=3028787 RepID=UPI0029168AC5|nr:aminotransferase class V-fold PLP-dependent enzyme [Asticcacaulis sp. 201]MDV6331988.1 aminotransferase class V-fold PLP-dependent enzyme [Asticcacaulis sp. 201]
MSDLFDLPPGGPYLLSHSAGLLPVAARGEFEAKFFTPWAAKPGESWPLWLEAIDDFRTAMAGLLGGRAADYCPQPNVSAGLFALLSGLTPRDGRDTIVMSPQAFPSLGFVAQQAQRLGFRFRLVDGDPAHVANWDAALAPDVAVVVVMHVHSNTSIVSPVAAIAELARARGIFSIVDVAQSAGLLPIDVSAWRADALVGSCIKWLCGGPGAGFLWCPHDLKPLNVGWFSHEDPFAFDIRDFRYATDARRFWGGTPSVAPYVLATSGVKTIAAIGVEAVLAHNRALIARIDAEDRSGKGGTLCHIPTDIEKTMAALIQAGCRFDRRGDTLRLSFHIYNTSTDADIVARCLV